ncbi:unnamed protein product [Auanema sp. JU1783]|nr:unnamed protein product [Auanema sp. JU1783]
MSVEDIDKRRQERTRLKRKSTLGGASYGTDCDVVAMFPHNKPTSSKDIKFEKHIPLEGKNKTPMYTVKLEQNVKNVVVLGKEVDSIEEGYNYCFAKKHKNTGEITYRPALLYSFETKYAPDPDYILGNRKPPPVDFTANYTLDRDQSYAKRALLTNDFGSSKKIKMHEAALKRSINDATLEAMLKTAFASSSVLTTKEDIKLEQISLINKAQSSILPVAVQTDNVKAIYPISLFLSDAELEAFSETARDYFQTKRSELVAAGFPDMIAKFMPVSIQSKGSEAVAFLLLGCMTHIIITLGKGKVMLKKTVEELPFPEGIVQKVMVDFLSTEFDRGANNKAPMRLQVSSEQKEKLVAHVLALALTLSPNHTLPLNIWQQTIKLAPSFIEKVLVGLGCEIIQCSVDEAVKTGSMRAAKLTKPPGETSGRGPEDSSGVESPEMSESNYSERNFLPFKIQNIRLKRLQELRNNRRTSLLHSQAIEFENLTNGFPEVYFDWYNECVKNMLKDPVYFYQCMVNSFKHYHQKHFSNTNHEGDFVALLKNKLLYSSKELTIKYTDVTQSAIFEVKTQILLQFHVLWLTSTGTVDEVVKNLRCLYIWTDPTTMKSFLEETVCDLFAHVIPKVICQVFEELCVALPVDLEEHNLVDETDEPLPWITENNNSSQLKELHKIIEETALDLESSKEDRKKKKETLKNAKLSEPKIVSPSKPLSQLRKVPKIVPETPEEKLMIHKDNPENAEVVKQTPMAKLRGINKKGSKRLSELVKLSEERTRPKRAAAIVAAKAVLNSSVAPNSNKELLLGLNTPSPRPNRSARLNLIDRFAATPETRRSTRKLNPGRKSSEEDLSSGNSAKRARTDGYDSSSSKSASKSDALGEQIGFTSEQLKRYKQRMMEISRNKVFEPVDSENRERTSLFEEHELEQSRMDEKNVQKNRTGRLVRAQCSSTVHIAHILLNVHNPSPLEPFKTGKVAGANTTKIQKLVRIAKKKDKIKLNRLRNRNRNQRSSPHDSQTSDSLEF